METGKIGAYLGFCMRSGKIALGVGRAGALEKGVFLLMADGTISENPRKALRKLQSRFSCPLVTAEEISLGDLLP